MVDLHRMVKQSINRKCEFESVSISFGCDFREQIKGLVQVPRGQISFQRDRSEARTVAEKAIQIWKD